MKIPYDNSLTSLVLLVGSLLESAQGFLPAVDPLPLMPQRMATAEEKGQAGPLGGLGGLGGLGAAWGS